MGLTGSRQSGCGANRRYKGDVPGQQLCDAVDPVIGDAAEHLAQVDFGIEAVELGAFNEGVDRGGALAAGVGAGEQIILPAKGERANRAFGSVVADLQRAVVKVARERGPAGTSIADCFGRFAAAGDRRERCVKERGETSMMGRAKRWRRSRRCSGGRPMAARSTSNSCPIRCSASRAIGALLVTWMS
jgi:hypothetical protein